MQLNHERVISLGSSVVSIAFVLILSATFQSPTWAGKYNTVVNIGDEAPQWQDLPGTDGKLHSSDELKDAKATVVVFTCNSCPYAIDAESRLIDLAKAYESKGVQIVAVNVNKVEEDLLPAMKERAELKKYPFTYLFDESQKIAKDFGAKYTPEFFLLDAQRKIVYMGSMDDSPDGKDVKQQYLRSAIEAVLNGQTVTDSETVPIGCRIRLERERRRRR